MQATNETDTSNESKSDPSPPVEDSEVTDTSKNPESGPSPPKKDDEGTGTSNKSESDPPPPVDDSEVSEPTPPPEEDDEGLLVSGYDVIICGTNLVHSILSSALSMAGKTVLHCDGADCYGETDGIYPLKGLLDWAERRSSGRDRSDPKSNEKRKKESILNLDPEGGLGSVYVHSRSHMPDEDTFDAGTTVITPYGGGVVLDRTMDKITISLTSWKLANNTHPKLYYTPIQPQNESDPPSIQSQHYHDSRHSLSQSRSFAIDLTPYLLFASSRPTPLLISSAVADYLEFKSIRSLSVLQRSKNDDDNTPIHLRKVPCSKADVFRSELLSPLEKRKLMKLLQSAMDYGIHATTSRVVENLNEIKLREGRSLMRPQNKSVEMEKILAIGADDREGDERFEEYLEKDCKLSEHLKNIVIHTLGMVREDCRVKEGMMGLYRHLESLGKFGDTAFLGPIYGSGELSQAFCRSSAVNGGIYLLRRAPLQINTSNATLLLAPDPDPSFGSNEEKSIPFKSVVISRNVLLNDDNSSQKTSRRRRRILRRISVVKSRLPAEEERDIVIVPPKVVRNDHVVQCLILDQSACVSPYGYALVQLSTMIDDEPDPTKIKDDVLKDALTSLLSCQNRDCDEIHHVSFSVSVPHDHSSSDDTQKEFNNVHVSNRPGLSLTVDGAFDEAERIFERICPGEDFLVLSEEKTKERMRGSGEDEDEEEDVLESALCLIDGKNDDATSTAEE